MATFEWTCAFHPPSRIDQWYVEEIVRLIQVERLYGNRVHSRDDGYECVELAASQALYNDMAHTEAADKWFKVQCLAHGCVFHIRDQKWFILRDPEWKQLAVPRVVYHLESFAEDLIRVKAANQPVRYDDDDDETELFETAIRDTAKKYRCDIADSTVQYIADLWVTLFGFCGKDQLKAYLVELARDAWSVHLLVTPRPETAQIELDRVKSLESQRCVTLTNYLDLVWNKDSDEPVDFA